jgi:GNAT superfamily N-acetyltransferase
MPLLNNQADVRALLETDRAWSVYALGDLAPGLFEQCEWHRPADETSALVLVCRIFAPPVLFALGTPAAVRPLLDEIANEPELYLHIRPEILPLLQERYEVYHEKTMWRMVLPPGKFRPAGCPGAVGLTTADLPALEGLYSDGAAAGESPDFFSPSMVADGVFYGVYEGNDLVAAAGTHLAVPTEGIGCVGNIYTRRDRRGRGLAAGLTSAVTRELLDMGVRTVALNVYERNASAIRVYERLGFVGHCFFKEGFARLRRLYPCGDRCADV